MARGNTPVGHRKAKKEGTEDDWKPTGTALDDPNFRKAAKAQSDRDAFHKKYGSTSSSFNVDYKTDGFGGKSYGTAEVNERRFRKTIDDADKKSKSRSKKK